MQWWWCDTACPLQNLGVEHLDHGLYELCGDLKSCCGCSYSIFSLPPRWSIQVCVSLPALFNKFLLPVIGVLWRKLQNVVGTQVFLSFLSLMPLSFPVLTLFSGQGGDDSAKKKVVMERVGDCGSEDKDSSFVFCLAVLNVSTIH